MKKLFYEIRKLFWLRECGHAKLRGYLWQRLEQNLYRQRYMSVPAHIADNLEAEEQWLLNELCEEYIPGNSRELYHLLMSCQGFPGVWTADALLKAVHHMAKVGTLKPSDVLRLIEYRKAKLRGGTEIIAKVREVIFDSDYFDEQTRKALAKAAFLNKQGFVVDINNDSEALDQMLKWYKDDVVFVRALARSGNDKARQMFFDMATIAELREYCDKGGSIVGCYSGKDDSFAKAAECRAFMHTLNGIRFFDEQLLQSSDKKKAVNLVWQFGISPDLLPVLAKDPDYDDFIEAYRNFIDCR